MLNRKKQTECVPGSETMVKAKNDQPTGRTDAIAMQHDVDYSVCGDNRKCKHKADRKMGKALDKIPYNEKQWGHWLGRNIINTKQKIGLGISKNGKSRRVGNSN